MPIFHHKKISLSVLLFAFGIGFSLIVFAILLIQFKLQPSPLPTKAATSANNYYVDSINGNDANSGTSTTSPWKSLAKVNATIFSPGDTINFKRGSSWTGQLTITSNGQAGLPITYKAYGTGNAPQIEYPCPSSFPMCYNDIIVITGNWNTVQDFFLTDTHQAGIHIKNGGSNNIVQNNEITNTGIGVMIEGSSYNHALHNMIHDLHLVVNTQGGNDDYGATGFVLSLNAANNEVAYNRCTNCQSPSYDFGTDGGFIEFWATVNNSSIHHNWSENTRGFIETGGDNSSETVNNNLLYYNVSVNNGGFACLHTGGSFTSTVSNMHMENNTIVETNGGYRVIDFCGGSPTSSMLTFKNNIIYSNFQIAATGNFTHTNNVYYLLNGSTLGFTLDSTEKTGNPLFTNVSTNDFHLQSNSPAINTGVNLGYSQDFDNTTVPQGSVPDMGAYEYKTVAPTTTQMPTPTLTQIPTSTAMPPSPTRTPASVTVTPTATLMPTATPAPKSTQFVLDLLLHGIGKGGDAVNPTGTGTTNPLHPQRTVTVDVYNFSNQLVMSQQGTVTYTATLGNFQGTVSMGNLASGTYIVKVKSPQYLRNTVSGAITVTQGQTVTLPSFALTTGDTNNDNVINILDYNVLLDCYSVLSPPKNCADATKKQLADITDDGQVNEFDYNLWLRETSVIAGQ